MTNEKTKCERCEFIHDVMNEYSGKQPECPCPCHQEQPKCEHKWNLVVDRLKVFCKLCGKIEDEPQPTPESWEKEYEKWDSNFLRIGITEGTLQDWTKKFIRSLLSEQKKEIIEDFIEWRRCHYCGELKGSDQPSDMCAKCLEEG